ncbi:MAG: T9SS type A sorting domain-containing protein [Bacteroidales bacterium]|nr:T9SS type A sorting domain-containing protein [Bacteroidales bacterium]
MKHYALALLLLIVIGLTSTVEAQIPISAGGTISQAYGIGTSATATLPSLWKIDKLGNVRTVGTYSAAVNLTDYRGGNGMGIMSANGIYNFGAGDAASATDRAIGWLSGTNGTQSGNLYTCLKNTGTEAIYSFNISYNVEKYKKGSNPAGFTIQLYYSTDGINWQDAGNDFQTDFAGGGFDNSGYNNAPGVTVNVTDKILATPLAAGDSIYLAWNYSVSSGNSTSFSQALGIDDVSIEANFYPPSFDAALIDWTLPQSNCALSTNETMAVKIMNMGIDTLTNFALSYSINGGITFITPENFSGQLLPGDDTIYTFISTADLSTVGIYQCVFAVHFATDQNNSNDTFQIAVTHIPTVNTFPYIQDFEVFNGWIGSDNTWQEGTPAQPGISSAKSGVKAWMTVLNANYPNNTESYLLSPCMDFSSLSDPRFSVWLNINIPDLGNDAMILESTIDNGSSWQKVTGNSGFYNYSGGTGQLPSPKWSGNTNGWQLFETNLNGLAGESNVRLRFRFKSNANNNGEGVAVDDILMRDPFSTDLALLQWVDPISNCGISDTALISVSILNTGTDTLSQIPITYSLNGGLTYITDEIITDTIFPGDTLIYTFNTAADFSMPNSYYCVVKLNLTTDENSSNDIINHTLNSLPYVTTFPYLSDFESSFTGWQTQVLDGVNQWEIGVPNQTALNNAFSGSRVWMSRLSYNYNNSSVSALISPCYDFTNLTDPYFSAMLNIRTEVGYDAMILESSIDGGQTWTKVTGDAGFYNDNSMFGTVNPPKWSGNNNGWEKFETALPQLAGESAVRFRFVFTSNTSNNDEGIAIDDVIVRDKYDNDLSVIEWVGPLGGCGLTNSEIVTLKIVNLGKNSQTGFSVGFSLNGGTFTFETFNGVINPGQTATYTFTAPADFSIPMDHSCMAVVNLVGDENPANDAFFTTVTCIPYITTYPYFQNFELGRAGWSTEAVSGNLQWDFGMPQQTVLNFPKSGIHCWMTGLDNDYDNNLNTYIESPCLNFASLVNPQISVWLNIKINDEGLDAMILEQSTNGGTTWTKVMGGPNLYNFTDTIAGAALLPPVWSANTSGWHEFKSPLPGLAGQSNVKLRFRFVSNATDIDEGVAIDDIMIHDPFTNDLAVLEWISPISECNMTANEFVTIKIANLGTVGQSNFNIAFSTDGGMNFSPASTYPSVLNAGDTIAYTFPTAANFSLSGEYNCIAQVNLATEQNPNNDYAFAKVFSVPTFTTFPYFDDFEAFYSGWTSKAISGVNQWEKGTPDQIDLSYAHSGSQAYMTKLYSKYNNNSNTVLMSPCLNLSGVGNPKLSLWMNMKTEPGYDAMILEKSLNGGITWTKLDGDPGFYNNSSVEGPINNPPKWSGNSNGWTNYFTAAGSLLNQTNVRLRFRFASDLTGNDEGVAIDDFMIYQPVVSDLGVSNILSPVNDICGSHTDSIFIEITNYGTNTISQIPVKVDVLTPSTIMINIYDTINQSLAPGASATFFIDTVGTTESGTYYIFASTELAADTINYFNNMITSTFNIKLPLPLPYVENFEGANIEWSGTDVNIEQAHGSNSVALSADLTGSNTQAEAISTKIGPVTNLTRLKLDYRIVDATGSAYHLQNGDDFQLYITNDCFANNYMLFEINQSNHVSSDQLKDLEFDISAFDGDELFLNFIFNSGGNDFYVDVDNIVIADAPVVQLVNDTSLCGGTITLDAATAPQNTFYFWTEQALPDTISTASTLLVTQSGYYHVTVDNGFGMTSSDSVEIFINTIPVVDLGNDFYVCSSSPVDIVASGGAYYNWSNGATTAGITVNPTNATIYTVTVTDNNGCWASDNINIFVHQLPNVNLGPNQIVCAYESVTLNAGSNFTSYQWSTGATSQYLTIDSTGLGMGTFPFTVTVTNINQCQNSGTINITFDPCVGVQIPETVSFEIFPNPSDGIFNIKTFGNVNNQLLIHVYNAQGKLTNVYRFSDIYHNCTSTMNLKHLSKGIYFVKITNNNIIRMEKIVIH